MEIRALSVKELREKTGAGIMDCKRALLESGGDLEKAVDYLRQKGLALAARKEGRVAAEGLVGGLYPRGRQDWRFGGAKLRDGFCGSNP